MSCQRSGPRFLDPCVHVWVHDLWILFQARLELFRQLYPRQVVQAVLIGRCWWHPWKCQNQMRSEFQNLTAWLPTSTGAQSNPGCLFQTLLSSRSAAGHTADKRGEHAQAPCRVLRWEMALTATVTQVAELSKAIIKWRLRNRRQAESRITHHSGRKKPINHRKLYCTTQTVGRQMGGCPVGAQVELLCSVSINQEEYYGTVSGWRIK